MKNFGMWQCKVKDVWIQQEVFFFFLDRDPTRVGYCFGRQTSIVFGQKKGRRSIDQPAAVRHHLFVFD